MSSVASPASQQPLSPNFSLAPETPPPAYSAQVIPKQWFKCTQKIASIGWQSFAANAPAFLRGTDGYILYNS